ncbi:hypothetical protein FI667_g4455, partial [Globisporangium splendens]
MVYASPYGNVPIPEDKSMWDFVEQHGSSANADAPAFICGLTARTVTFAQLLTRAKLLVAGLHKNGIRKGDVVILHSFNCVEYPIVFFALNRLGAICSPSSPLFTAQELSDQMELSKAKAIISHKALAQVAVDAAKRSGIHESNVYTMADAPGSLPIQSVEQLIAKNLAFPALPRISPHDVVTLPFSSGTTARPKGVELTARAMLAIAIDFSYLDRPGPLSLGLLPFFHIMATMLFHSCVYKGKALVVLPRFDPETFLQVVEKYKLEKLIIAPPVALFLAQHPMVAKYDLSHVKQMGCGGAPLGIEVERMAEKRMNATVLQGFGMTELAGATTYSTTESKRVGSAGKLLPNALLKVKSLTTGAELPPNEVGELLFHTPQLMRGYFNNPEATNAAFDEDGFLRTGDIGYIDDDGFVFIVDRIKELIKYKGHQVAPAELEDVLNNHPSVADACCVRGLDLKTGEEIPKAYVVLKGGAPLVTAEDIMAFVQTKVAPYKFVRELEFTDAIPKSVSGKILRRELQVKENEKIAAAKLQSRL